MPFSAILGFAGASEQASATRSAARESARAQLESARLAAEAAKFRPVGVTTRYGSSNFQFDPQGYLSGAGYTVAPELRGYQDRLMGLTERGLGQAEVGEARLRPNVGAAESLFSLGNQYLAQSPEETAQKYMESQYNLLAPSRERQLSQLQNQLFQTGRSGLSVGATGMRPSGAAGLGATTPEMEAYYNALAQQDLQLAQQAEQAGQQRTAFGTGLFSTGNQLLNQYYGGQINALSPFTTYLGAGSTIEQLGQQPLEMGSALGGRSATAGGNVGQALLTGGMGAARALQSGAGISPLAGLLTGASKDPRLQTGFEKLFGGGSGGYEMANPNTNYGTQNLTPEQIGTWANGGFTGYVPL